CFVGPQGDVRLDVALPVADVRETLRVFQPALAVAYTTKHQEARQPIGESTTDCPEQLLLLRRPHAGMGALAESEPVRSITLGVHGRQEARLDTELLGHAGGQRTIASGANPDRIPGRFDDP